MLGLYAFFYATPHVSAYTGLDQFFNWRAIVDDMTKRQFIFVGFAAFALLIPLAVTSTNAAVKRMGYVRWPMLHAVILGVLLLVRLLVYLRSRLAMPSTT